MNTFELERRKHFDFFLSYYREKNWQVIQDNIDSQQKIDWDVKLEIFAGQFVLVDEKVRGKEFDDLIVEIIQDMRTGNLGWFFGPSDWILYGSWVVKESVWPFSLYLIRLKSLKEYIYGLKGFVKTCISSPEKGWGITWNIVFNWEDLIRKNIVEKLI